MSLGEYFSPRCLIPIDAVLSHTSAICRKLTVFDHTAVVVLEKIMGYDMPALLLQSMVPLIVLLLRLRHQTKFNVGGNLIK